IQHASARRYHRDGADLVTLRPLCVLVGVNDLQFPEADKQHSHHSHDQVGDDGQPLLRQSIIVAKPVRHENPARESLSWWPWEASVCSPPVSIYARDLLASRIQCTACVSKS